MALTAVSVVEVAAEQKWLDPVGERVGEALEAAAGSGSAVGQQIRNALHGTWLGHPLHPALTDIPLGCWAAALGLDTAECLGAESVGPGADAALGLGLAGAVLAALSGLADWQYTEGRARRVGVAHAALNSGAAVLNLASLVLRKRGARIAGKTLSAMGFGAVMVSAYLGGHLLMSEQVGVNHSAPYTPPEDWTSVMAEGELPEGKLTAGTAGVTPVVLLRRGGTVRALISVCSHMGGPLAEGSLEDDSVRCPWHGSRFCLRTGKVLDGPAVYPQPRLEARVRDGQVQVRAAQG